MAKAVVFPQYSPVVTAAKTLAINIALKRLLEQLSGFINSRIRLFITVGPEQYGILAYLGNPAFMSKEDLQEQLASQTALVGMRILAAKYNIQLHLQSSTRTEALLALCTEVSNTCLEESGTIHWSTSGDLIHRLIEGIEGMVERLLFTTT